MSDIFEELRKEIATKSDEELVTLNVKLVNNIRQHHDVAKELDLIAFTVLMANVMEQFERYENKIITEVATDFAKEAVDEIINNKGEEDGITENGTEI